MHLKPLLYKAEVCQGVRGIGVMAYILTNVVKILAKNYFEIKFLKIPIEQCYSKPFISFLQT